MYEINSKDYWDGRFDKDWVEMLGRLQSAFFATEALTVFPEWLTSQIKENNLSICDWGCALGDGTNELYKDFPQNSIIGVDFSSVAIEDAKVQYPQLTFQCHNFLEEQVSEKFDVLFTSNVLEHFANPWDVLSLLSTFVKKHLVILIPFKEFDRHKEHEYTFDVPNIPINVGPKFQLTHFRILDTGKCQPTYWSGFQAFLIYSQANDAMQNNSQFLSEKSIKDIDKDFFSKMNNELF